MVNNINSLKNQYSISYMVGLLLCVILSILLVSTSVLAQDINIASTRNIGGELLKDLSIIDKYYAQVREKVTRNISGQDNVFAEEPEQILEKSTQDIAQPSYIDPNMVGYTEQGRDPFALTNRIYTSSQNRTHGRYNFIPGQIAPSAGAIPRMKMRGLVRGKDNDLAALLEIVGDGIYVVRPDDTIGIYGSSSNSVVKVRSIDELSVVVELGSLGQVVIVR